MLVDILRNMLHIVFQDILALCCQTMQKTKICGVM